MEDSEVMACPYNKAHLIDPLRMPYHLMKCRKNHPDIQLAVCPYSALHEVPPAELQFHMANCPNKRLVEGIDPPYALLHSLSGTTSEMIKGCTDLPPPAKVQFGNDDDDEENWDNSANLNIPQISPPSPTIYRRGRLRHQNDGTNHSLSSHSTMPSDVRVRRPVSHSVAEKLKPKPSSDSSRNSSTVNERRYDFVESESDFETVTVTDRVSPDGDSLFLKSLDSGVSSFNTTGLYGSSSETVCEHSSPNQNIEERNFNLKHRHVIQGRGRARLLNILPDGNERRPGHNDASFPMFGRGKLYGANF